MLEIKSNGPDWNSPSEPVTHLLKLLDKKPLDPVYEAMGNFIVKNKKKVAEDPHYAGSTQFFGHFATVPFCFNIITDEKVVIEELTKAIRMNQNRLDYERLRKNMF
ncbi:hypothetical protein ACFFJY_01640 [Fictibacillus aquaticus]|uniref:Uncharacterized protein n=1 Tax=Fictibacillus aquaticus TaxID=2021314 RepID=A0A235F824_9BACL|nr:hypothetical protein [Fictibacillus aquaticus]OYD57418.1 hypothetical protein CGZ90_12110 [Fictibacillus aquaticus]